jgi:hypothetical protein
MFDSVIHTLAIHDRLARFFQAFDEKDFAGLRDCLCDEVFTDYALFRGQPPATVTGDRYVADRRAALAMLDMQHNFHNLRVEIEADAGAATARCNFMIYRFHPSNDGADESFFHSCGHYVFGLTRVDGTWRIARIAQHLLRSVGTPAIHAGAAARAPER